MQFNDLITICQRKVKRSHLNGQLRGLLRDAANAKTLEAYSNVTTVMEEINPAAAQKFKAIDPATFAMYTAYESKMQLLLMTTSNDAEQEFMRFKRRKIRNSKTPLQFFEGVLNLWVDLLNDAKFTSAQLVATDSFLTSYAKEQIGLRVQLSKKYIAEDNAVFCYVTPEDRQNNLPHHTQYKDMDKSVTHRFTYACDVLGNCECGRGWAMTGFFCEHCIALVESKGLLQSPNFLSLATHPIWRTSTFMKCFPPNSRISIPVVSELLVADSDVISISQNNLRGRPKKNARKKRLWQEKGQTKKESRREYKFHRELYDSSTPVVVQEFSGKNNDFASDENSSCDDTSCSEDGRGGYFSNNEDNKRELV